MHQEFIRVLSENPSPHVVSRLAAVIRNLSIERIELVDSECTAQRVCLLAGALTLLGDARCLTLLRVCGARLSDLAMMPLIQSVPLCAGEALTLLDLQSNWLSADSARALADVLPRCNVLRSLLLRSNAFGDVGVALVADALPLCKSLETIDLADNGVGVAGAARLADVLPRCRALSTLSLASNRELGDDGVALIARALRSDHPRRHCSLAVLSLRGTAIGGDGVASLARALRENMSLVAVHGVDDRRVDAMLARNKSNRLQRALNLQLRCWLVVTRLEAQRQRALLSLPDIIVVNLRQRLKEIERASV
jgi:Leucine Rich repeat